MQEKYGFVYIWLDRKHKRYYIGCHWGQEDDGYICSNTHMNHSYKKRPEDFKRRILERVYTDKKDLLEREYYWLQMIKPEELRTKYYNLHNHHFGHWATSPKNKLTIRQKISTHTKEAMQRPDVRERYLEGMKTKDMSWTSDPEIIKRKSEVMKEVWQTKEHRDKCCGKTPWNKDKHTGVSWNRGKKFGPHSPEMKEVYRQKSRELWEHRTDEQKHDIQNKILNTYYTNKKNDPEKYAEIIKNRTAKLKGRKRTPEQCERIRVNALAGRQRRKLEREKLKKLA